jgi:hypothetical protein
LIRKEVVALGCWAVTKKETHPPMKEMGLFERWKFL